jgi:hypothetical protein
MKQSEMQNQNQAGESKGANDDRVLCRQNRDQSPQHASAKQRLHNSCNPLACSGLNVNDLRSAEFVRI